MAKTEDYTVSGLSVKRDGDKYTASWSVKSDAKKKAKGITLKSTISYLSGTQGVASSNQQKDKVTTELSKDSLGTTSKKLTFTRSDWYPKTKKRVQRITASARLWADKTGSKKYSYEASSYAFEAPKTPTVSLAVNDACTALTASVKADEGAGKKERYDSVVEWDYESYVSGKKKSWTKLKTYPTSTKTSFDSTSGNVGTATGHPVNALAAGEYVRVRCRAYSRGLIGDGEACAYEYHCWAQPAKATITSAKVSGSQVVVRLRTNASTYAPVDSVQLYRYRGTSLPVGLDGWEKVDGAKGNSKCTGLSDSVADARPNSKGMRVWYCAVTTHDLNGSVQSAAVECTDLATGGGSAAPVDTSVVIISAESVGDGESAKLRVGWLASDTYDNTEVAWSSDPDALLSTDEPDSYEASDSRFKAGTTTYNGATYTYCDVKVSGLVDGTTYFFWARRASTANKNLTGDWSEVASLYVSSTPTVPVLSVPTAVPRGSSFTAQWSFAGEQAKWQLVWVKSSGDEFVFDGGDGAARSCVVDGSLFEGVDSAELAVEVSLGGDYTRSATVTVVFADVPTATVSCERVITAKGHAVNVTLDPTAATATLTMTAMGATSARPDGADVQYAGDVVWTETFGVGAGGTATLNVPDEATLIDGARYLIEVVPVNSGLTGDAASPTFTYTDADGDSVTTSCLEVAWAHQASAPASCAVVVDSETGYASITPEAPSDALSTDTWELYRSTPDGHALVGESFAFGATAVDTVPPYSAYGDCEYVVCTVTEDGDRDWDSYGYASFGKCVTVDFGARRVELPYNIDLSDSFGKSFEARSYLGGGKQSGTWGGSIERTCSVSCSIARGDGETASLLRSLAQYAGACFARFPDGRAYECDCQVKGIDDSCDSGVTSVSMDITEVETSVYRASVG